MSFDLYFVDRADGERWEDALDRREQDAASQVDDETWRRIVDAVTAVLPEVEEDAGGDWHELTDLRTSIQVRWTEGWLSVEVSYAGNEDHDVLGAALVAVVEAIERLSGLVAYDPQADDAFLSDGGAHFVPSFRHAQRALERAVLGRRPRWRTALQRLRPGRGRLPERTRAGPSAWYEPPFFANLSDADAARHLDRYLASGEAALPTLVELAAARGVRADLTLETLVDVLGVCGELYREAGEGARALAVPDDPAPGTYADPDLALHPLLDRTTWYFGESFRRSWPAQLRWSVGTKGHVGHQEPVVAGFGHGMSLNVRIVVLNLLAELVEGDRGKVERGVAAWVEDVTA